MVMLLHRTHHQIGQEAHDKQCRHAIHRRVVQARRRVNRPLRRNRHQLRDGHRLCRHQLIKLLNRDYGMNRFRVLANMAQSPQEGRNLFAKLTKVTDRFLDVALQYVGAVPYDECVRKAVQKQRAVYEAFPRSKCALAFKAIAQKVDTWPLPANPRGHLEFFVERLVHQTSAGPVL